MDRDIDYDVKRYNPKNGRAEWEHPQVPDTNYRSYDGLDETPGGVNLTTSEILDFSEGSDSN